MDRRQQKTRAAIFASFSSLLEKRSFRNITVQQIIDGANIGRSTFYAHFETKDDLLKAMCTDIFDHVFSEELTTEATHDFSRSNHSLRAELTHLLYHIRDERRELSGILCCEGGELFMRYFKEYLSKLFAAFLDRVSADIPQDFIMNQLVGSFAEAVLWWIRADMAQTPETVAGWYLSTVQSVFCREIAAGGGCL